MIKRNTLILVLAIAVVLSICLCGLWVFATGNVSSEKSEAAVSSEISLSPTVTPTPKPTVKPRTEPTASPSPKATAKTTTKPAITPTPKPDEFAGEVFKDCPTCGGRVVVTGPVTGDLAWTCCGNCGNYCVGVNEPQYSCIVCGRSGLYPEEMSKDISYKCKDCADYEEPIYSCTICGRTSEETYITKYDLCEDCYAENTPYTNCYCSNCGVKISSDDTDGLCDSCFRTQPNVWCPNCGEGFFTTGVGVDGFTCKSCEYNWLP